MTAAVTLPTSRALQSVSSATRKPLPKTAFKSSFQHDQVGLQTLLSHLYISTNMH